MPSGLATGFDIEAVETLLHQFELALDAFAAGILNYSALLTMGSAVAAACAALATWLQSHRARVAYEADMLLSMGNRYNTAEMAAALRILARSVDTGASVPSRWHAAYLSGDEKAQEINNARRLVSSYFIDIARLSLSGVITRRMAYILISRRGLDLFYRVCEPLNDRHYPERNKAYVKRLRSIRPRYLRRSGRYASRLPD